MGKPGRSLCIVDTCSLVYLKDVKLADRPLHEWLWNEFDIRFSSVVLDEFSSFQKRVGFRYNWKDYVWRISNIQSYERAIFSSHQRRIEEGKCKHCRQVTWKNEIFKPDLMETDDRGERHNCCIALDAVLRGKYAQVIFLSDDLHALRDYANYFFDTFPLGSVWTLLDFVTYLFTRYYGKIPLDDVEDALRDVNAQDAVYMDSERKIQRLNIYNRKVERIYQILSQIKT